MADHRLVEAGAIAVVVAVHLGRVVRVIELQQARVRTPDQFERPGRHRASARAREHAGQRLLAEVSTVTRCWLPLARHCVIFE